MRQYNHIKSAAVVASLMLFGGCSTIHFTNGPVLDDETLIEREQWHHLGFNGFVEFSKPFNLNYNCHQQQWDSITIEKTLFNSLASMPLADLPLTIYAPWSIRYSCRDTIDAEKTE